MIYVVKKQFDNFDANRIDFGKCMIQFIIMRLHHWRTLFILPPLVLFPVSEARVIEGSNGDSLSFTTGVVQVMFAGVWGYICPEGWTDKEASVRQEVHTTAATDTSLTFGRCSCNVKLVIFKLTSRINVLTFPMKLPWHECHKVSLIISQHWFR